MFEFCTGEAKFFSYQVLMTYYGIAEHNRLNENPPKGTTNISSDYRKSFYQSAFSGSRLAAMSTTPWLWLDQSILISAISIAPSSRLIWPSYTISSFPHP